MKIRKLVAIVGFLLSMGVGYVGYSVLGQVSDGYTKFVAFFFLATGAGGVLFSLAVGLVRNWQFQNLYSPSGGISLPEEWNGKFLIVVFGLLGGGCLMVLLKALFNGSISNLFGGSSVYFGEKPVVFVFHVTLWCSLCAAFFWVSRRAAKGAKDSAAGKATRAK